ncbi:hypothetical protein RF55_24751 [Lasius niger]|uniref:DUF5641 domain-containing protein n=1 Tax=Lasius niger TaxID=67767 RepID=A0A0J7JUS7_LASNI|nr:hypothetical protein RF55_24751 [Lasius niger]
MTEETDEVVAITPAMFLRDIQEEKVSDLDQIGKSHLSKNLRYRQRLKEDLRRRFRIQYLGQLSQRNKHKHATTPFSVGDIVLVANDLQKRLDWPMARIKKFFPGRDGHVRVVKLQTSSGELIRPIQRLIPLKMELSDDNLKKHFDLTIPSTQSQKLPGAAIVLPEKLKEPIKADMKPTPELKTRSGRIVKKPKRSEF